MDKNNESISLRIQPTAVGMINEIATKRLNDNGVKYSKSTIISEAVSDLHKKEFGK